MSSKNVAIKSPRKLIEVAIPLDKINAAASREKSIRHGHPSTLHLWWARRPLAAARAVLFAQLVNDPGYERHLNRGINKVEAVKERERLFKIIEDLVIWENSNNEEVLSRARAEIRRSWQETCELNRNHPDAATLFDPNKLPAFHDPFAGGGTIPLEAQRLGLESYASDLNPVAVTINKAMIEIPPHFGGRTPVGPIPLGERDPSLSRKDWPGATGLAEDVRRYGTWMRAQAEKQIGDFYPKVEVTDAMAAERPDLKPLVGQKLTVITWLWARTVKSPNPAYSHVDVPLVSSYVLSAKEGSEAYLEPVVTGDRYTFRVKREPIPETAVRGTKQSGRATFSCILSGAPITSSYIKMEGTNGRIGQLLYGIVAAHPTGRVYFAGCADQMATALSVPSSWSPDIPLSNDKRAFSLTPYGFQTFGDMFTRRNLLALNTFQALIKEAVENAKLSTSLEYATALEVYLSCCLSRAADYWSGNAIWEAGGGFIKSTFNRSALPMAWDYAEGNPFSMSTGSWEGTCVQWVTRAVSNLGFGKIAGYSSQANAQTQHISLHKVVSTDPPYFDNIGYADLSDFFYGWLRRSLRETYPDIYSTRAVPKADELVSSPERHGGSQAAETFFLEGMSEVFSNLAIQAHPAFPVTIYYAFKQASGSAEGQSSTGWETFLAALIESGFCLLGTWPIRTERPGRVRENSSNALASSIVLVCRKRDIDAKTIPRAQFLRELRSALPDALTEMTRGGENSPVAPVDLSQAIIGPGMGIFSRYKAVLEANGTPMTVKSALEQINRFLADDDFDAETQFCLQWFETNYWKEGLYGQADVAARAKGTGVEALARAGVLLSGGGKVQLVRPAELSPGWHPESGNETPVWEGLHHLIHALNAHGEQAAGRLLAAMPSISGPARTLSYRLYTLCERQKLAEDARTYNELIGSWAAIEVAAQEYGYVETQADLFQR